MQGSGQRLCRLNPYDKATSKQFDRRMSGTHSQSGRHTKYKDVLPLPSFEIRFLCYPASSLIVILTEISRHKTFFKIMLERSLRIIHMIVCTGASIFLVLHLILNITYSVFISSYGRESGPDIFEEKEPRNSIRNDINGKKTGVYYVQNKFIIYYVSLQCFHFFMVRQP